MASRPPHRSHLTGSAVTGIVCPAVPARRWQGGLGSSPRRSSPPPPRARPCRQLPAAPHRGQRAASTGGRAAPAPLRRAAAPAPRWGLGRGASVAESSPSCGTEQPAAACGRREAASPPGGAFSSRSSDPRCWDRLGDRESIPLPGSEGVFRLEGLSLPFFDLPNSL